MQNNGMVRHDLRMSSRPTTSNDSSQPALSGASGKGSPQVQPGQLSVARAAGVGEPTEAGLLCQRSEPEVVG